ncbi:MAG: hypothetical protein FJX54_20175 [Alphaproteobacteria bacterium]|nr:hypothetical protein [Alphaproteobacteria bacterium]
MSFVASIRVAAAALIILVASAGIAPADGLRRFQSEVLPRIPKGDLTYESASPLGPSGFVLERVVIRDRGWQDRPAGEVRMRRLAVEEIDFERVWTSDPPHFAKLRMEGVVAPRHTAFLKQQGIPDKPSDLKLDYRYDPRTRVLTVSRLDAVSPGAAHLSLNGILENVRSMADTRQLLDTALLRSLRLTYEDHSALRQAVRASADKANRPEAALMRDWQAAIAAISAGKGARTVAAADALVSFLADHRKPNGRLQISMAPPRPISFGLMVGSIFSADPGQTLGLDTAYAGTRTGAAAAAVRR